MYDQHVSVQVVRFQSINGVYVNDTRLKSDCAKTLKDGDIIRLGVALKRGQEPPFVWKFKEKLKVKKLPMKAKIQENRSCDLQVGNKQQVTDTPVDTKPCSNEMLGKRKSETTSDTAKCSGTCI